MNTSGIQSTAQAAPGSGAALINEFTLALYVGSALIFLGVMALLVMAVFGRSRQVDARRWIIGGGLVFPGVVLSALLTYSLAVGATLSDAGASGPLRFLLNCISSSARLLTGATDSAQSGAIRIDIVGWQWWWEVRYQSPDNAAQWVTLANELHLPAGRPAHITLRAADVIHSFWVPSLAGKVDMIPGRTNRLTLRADEPGIHRGQCAEYCGGQHALMALYVEVRSPPEFDAWLARQAQPASAPSSDFLAKGRDAFLRAGCGQCHTVRGTAAAGTSGPDLTHVGGRRSLAAGILRNHVGTLGGWIADPQSLKPGSLMPPTRSLAGDELRALAAWMESLK